MPCVFQGTASSIVFKSHSIISLLNGLYSRSRDLWKPSSSYFDCDINQLSHSLVLITYSFSGTNTPAINFSLSPALLTSSPSFLNLPNFPQCPPASLRSPTKLEVFFTLLILTAFSSRSVILLDLERLFALQCLPWVEQTISCTPSCESNLTSSNLRHTQLHSVKQPHFQFFPSHL